MQSITATTPTRAYVVDDDGDAVQLLLVEAGRQVGGAVFPFGVGGEDAAFDLANMMGSAFVASAPPRSVGLS